MKPLAAFFSIMIILALSYSIARYGLGNPFGGLGSNGFLTEEQVKALEEAYGLKGDALTGFLNFLKSLFEGGPVSSIYSKASEEVLVKPFLLTLAVISLASLSSFLLVSASFLLRPESLKLIGAFAFVPEYLYAVLFLITAWNFGWPRPVASASLDKALAYFVIELLAISSRLAHLMEELNAELEKRDFVEFWKAVGASEISIRKVKLSVALKAMLAFALTLVAEALERSVIIEYLIDFAGIGYFLFTSVVEVDVGLASTGFVMIAVPSYLLVKVASSIRGEIEWLA